MILIINLNLTVDYVINLENFKLGRVHRALSSRSQAGGKGINVARALKILGDENLVSGFLGGNRGRWIEQELIREQIRLEKIEIPDESRTCVILLDEQAKQTTVINEVGPGIKKEQYDSWVKLYEQTLLVKSEQVVLTGSFPPGIDPEAAGDIVRTANRRGKLTFLDTSDNPLYHGFKARPFVLKINQFEAESLLGCKIKHGKEAMKAARYCVREGISIAVITLGKQGAVIANKQGAYLFKAPRAGGWNDVGSGDSLMAGVIYGVKRGLSLVEIGNIGVAVAASNTRYGFGRIDKEDFATLVSQVKVKKRFI